MAANNRVSVDSGSFFDDYFDESDQEISEVSLNIVENALEELNLDTLSTEDSIKAAIGVT